MAREQVEKTIDDQTYTICRMQPKKSLKLLVRLVKIIGAPVGAAMDGGQITARASFLDQDIDLGAVVASLCDRLDENAVETIVDALMENVIHVGSGEISKVFDAHFGEYGLPHLFKVVGAALEVEYGDFFGEGSAADLLQKIAVGTTRAPAT